MCFYVLAKNFPVLVTFFFFFFYGGLGHIQDRQIGFIHTEFLHLTCPSVLLSPLDPSALLHSPNLREAIKCFGPDPFRPSASWSLQGCVLSACNCCSGCVSAARNPAHLCCSQFTFWALSKHWLFPCGADFACYCEWPESGFVLCPVGLLSWKMHA